MWFIFINLNQVEKVLSKHKVKIVEQRYQFNQGMLLGKNLSWLIRVHNFKYCTMILIRFFYNNYLRVMPFFVRVFWKIILHLKYKEQSILVNGVLPREMVCLSNNCTFLHFLFSCRNSFCHIPPYVHCEKVILSIWRMV